MNIIYKDASPDVRPIEFKVGQLWESSIGSVYMVVDSRISGYTTKVFQLVRDQSGDTNFLGTIYEAPPCPSSSYHYKGEARVTIDVQK